MNYLECDTCGKVFEDPSESDCNESDFIINRDGDMYDEETNFWYLCPMTGCDGILTDDRGLQ